MMSPCARDPPPPQASSLWVGPRPPSPRPGPSCLLCTHRSNQQPEGDCPGHSRVPAPRSEPGASAWPPAPPPHKPLAELPGPSAGYTPRACEAAVPPRRGNSSSSASRVAWAPPLEATPVPFTVTTNHIFCCALYQLEHKSPRSQGTQWALRLPSAPRSRPFCARVPAAWPTVPMTPSRLRPRRAETSCGRRGHRLGHGAAERLPQVRLSQLARARVPGRHRRHPS